ncbi:VWFA-related domain-containing protein [Granulicella rosea]|uniref:VWFA-related domain-containing protein n=1 Tax=Granulicella rosea TaxID=474952 RepID=A0A239EC75_9BACT|nr:VWA domain-containing protein [Granulicella rosea]SNS42275.1 VWFA-related domain-containing protein [Granulicella rosea]
MAARGNTKRGWLAGIILALLTLRMGSSTSSGIAQQQVPATQSGLSVGGGGQGRTTLHVASQLVVLDVVVTQKDSALRTNLSKEDIHVTENGVAQKILYFESPAEHHIPAGTEIHSTNDLESRAPQAPVSVMVLDELNTPFNDMGFARYALEKYLNAQPNELSAPTMLLAVSDEHLQVLCDYTQDRSVILNALKKHLASYPWQVQRNPNRIRQMIQSLGALEQVAQATAGHPGHKNLFWVGHGFPGVELSGPNIDQAAATSLKAAVEQAVDMLRDDRMTLYTIDPTALSSTVSTTVDDDSGPLGDIVYPAADPFLGDVNFVTLAKASGGKSFFSRNDIDAEIEESARDGVNYYTLAYRPELQSDQERPYRKIRVTFTQPGLHANLRDGYYTTESVNSNPAARRATYDVDAAVENTMVYTGLEVHAVERPEAPGNFVVGISENQLTWNDEGGGQSSKLTLAVADIDRKGRILRRVTEDVTARRSTEAQVASRPQLIRTEINLPCVPGTSTVRFVVRSAANGRIGSASLSVPR